MTECEKKYLRKIKKEFLKLGKYIELEGQNKADIVYTMLLELEYNLKR